jgi:methanogenic corrinoid protein MtbC1
VVLSCAPDEWHDASLLMLGVLLRRKGWPVAYLGQAVPLEDLAAFADDVRATAVVLVAMRQATAEALSSWPQWLKASARTGRPPVFYGGRPFRQDPLLRARVPGHYLGDSVQAGIQRLEDILQRFTGAP